MDLKKTNYFDPRKMAARKRWTVQETGQGLIAMTGYAYLGDEEKTALFSGADLEARIRQASAEKPRETELYLRLSNWLVIRRRETLQLKSHAMQVLQLIWRGLFVDMAQQVIAASELKDFFGHTIDVAGLLTGQDISAQLRGRDLGDRVLIPIHMMRHGETVFLDDYTVERLSRELGVPVQVVDEDGFALVDAMFVAE